MRSHQFLLRTLNPLSAHSEIMSIFRMERPHDPPPTPPPPNALASSLPLARSRPAALTSSVFHEPYQLLLPRGLGTGCSLCRVHSCPRYSRGGSLLVLQLPSECHLFRQACPDCPPHPTPCSALCPATFYSVGTCIALCINLPPTLLGDLLPDGSGLCPGAPTPGAGSCAGSTLQVFVE